MIEVADVFRRFAADYLSAHGASMLPSHRRAIEDIVICRTAALGASALLGTDPDVLMKVDPLSAHVFAAISLDQPIFDLPEGADCFVGLLGPCLPTGLAFRGADCGQ